MTTTRPSLPLELVREIIFHLLGVSDTSSEPGVSIKPSWSLVQPLTLAAKAYRTLSLEFWFYTFYTKSPEDIFIAHNVFPQIKSIWTKEIHCVQIDSMHTFVWDLQGFDHLTKIRLDWLSRRIMPHYGSDDPADRLPFMHVSPSVTELDIRGLPWPSPTVFHNIGGILPELRVLKLWQNTIWCGLCHTCSVAKFSAPGPKTLVYEGGTGLPMHYARMFASLERLHTVSISIADFGSGTTTLSDNDHQNENLWAGECDRCMQIMYEDSAFRDRWVARKKGLILDGKEREAVYVCPPALKVVEWKFRAPNGDEDVEFLGSEGELSDSDDDNA